MSGIIFVLAIGPVQPFIAAARRTRDLWQGSAMLSALAAAGAAALQSQGAKLIFPHARSPASPGRASIDAAGVSNKIVAHLPAGANPGQLACQAKAAVLQALSGLGQYCLDELHTSGCISAIDVPLFNTQLQQVLECYSAWAELDADDDEAYLAAFSNAQRALDARKRLRDFAPSASARVGLALSSLDATSESVLTGQGTDRRLRAVHGINSTEGLDAFGLIKRVLGGSRGFPAVARVALQPWIAQWTDAQVGNVDALLAPLASYQLASQNNCAPGNPMARLNWDAELLITSRRRKWQAHAQAHAQSLNLPDATLTTALDELGIALSGPSCPPLPSDDGLYVAVLLADGDRMGECITREGQGQAGHQALSRALAEFAESASALVAKQGGACIYSGGDDVLALVAVAEALPCARALAEDFATRLGPHAGGRASLSVGLALVHVLMPFEQSRQLAAQALKLAKNGSDGDGLRNALGLVVQPRNGEAVKLAGAWDSSNGSSCLPGFDVRLAAWKGAFERGALAKGAPYDLRALISGVPTALLPGEAQRLLQRRQHGSDAALAQLLSHTLQLQVASTDADRKALVNLEREWYVGRWLAAHAGPAAADAAGMGLQSNPELAKTSMVAAQEPAT